MKLYALAALVGLAQASDDVTNRLIWNNDWNKYRASRKREVDCSVREAENWLGSRRCKYSWECTGARMCEGEGWCTGNDACDVIKH